PPSSLDHARLPLLPRSPTRRSSDLIRPTEPTSWGRITSWAWPGCWHPTAPPISPSSSVSPAPRGRRDRIRSRRLCQAQLPALERTEEHTSELQSPDHLVCRLLLETK